MSRRVFGGQWLIPLVMLSIVLYQGVFRNLDRAPERVIIVSSAGGEASTACSIR
jgi:hypothetical protein